LIILFIIGGIAAGIWLFVWVRSLPIPDFQTFDERKIVQSTRIYDRTGENLLYDVHQDIKRTVVPYEAIPGHVKNATIAIEDETFYQHKGVDIMGILRALIVDLKTGEFQQGGSTITQQLAKNTFLSPEKTIERKVKELFLSFKIESTYDKEEILTLYLNEIPYGGSNYGIQAASEAYFGKNVQDLTLAESAYLAAIPQAPSYYSPYGSHIDDLEERKKLVLKQMLKLGFISEEEMNKANEEEVKFQNIIEKGIRAPHFVMYVKSYLEEKYGKDIVESGGLKVTTTLDWELQEKAEKLTKQYAEENTKNYNAKNAGMVGMDPKTGQIIVMVGSKDYHDENYPGKFNVALGERQPGSSFKPFVYATAFKKGYTPETVVFDLKTEFNVNCNTDGTPGQGIDPDDCYMPQNYDFIYRGPMTLRNALAQSVNVPAVKMLYLAGVKDSIQTARDMGITTLSDPSRYGLTLDRKSVV